ncbi:MAG TPA: chromate efflux transporter [Thermomicrobiales bacterium]|nr:chromate efflux transporter [Thermomicrobiales bacterium]
MAERAGEGRPDNLREVALLSFKLGLTAFGGPAAHIAMLRQEVVERRKWMSDQHFLDMIGLTNLVPGPNSTEMVIHSGFMRAGWRGLIVSGVGFIFPAFTLVLLLSVLYVEYGTTTTGEWLLYGIKPVIIAIVVQALFGLARTATTVPDRATSLIMLSIGVVTAALYFLSVNELILLFGGALGGAALILGWKARARGGALALAPIALLKLPLLLQGVAVGAPVDYSSTRLFLTFLKIGAVLYGSGYVLLAFLEGDFIDRYGWLTREQLIDGVAIGQFTPGPVFTTATFVGYVTGGFSGAVLATLGIFIPSFIFVALMRPVLSRARGQAWTAALLDGVNAAALGLMAAVTVQLGRSALVDVVTVLLAVAGLLVLLRFRLNSAWLVIAGAVVGLVYQGLI